MKKIINGRLYDTETAKELGGDRYSNRRNFHHWAETLYKKRTGEFFIYGEGGPLSKYAEAVGLNEWSGGERIMPLSYAEAQEWAENHLSGDEYIDIFGEPEEDDTKQKITLSLSAAAIAKAKQEAAKAGITLSAYIENLI
jgi:hypothetical protein